MPLNIFFVLGLLCLLLADGTQSAELKDSLEVVSKTNSSAASSQEIIDSLSRETRIMVDEYRRLRESSEYQQAFSKELKTLDAAQKQQIASLQQQIAQARVTRQRILPLMRSMADALEKFVVLDLPFHQEDRLAAVLQLKQRLDRAGITVSARFRLLLEAYQLEQDYGGTIESWRGSLQQGRDTLSVEYLRVGRTALYFQTLDRERSGYWNAQTQEWVMLDEQYNRNLSQAMRVAQNQTAPQLLQLPLLGPGGDS
mgnify:CR=1 FL=1